MAKKKLNRKRVNTHIPVFTGNKYSENISIQLFEFNRDHFIERTDISDENFSGFKSGKDQYWLNTHGIHDVDQIMNICNKIGIHSLSIQDILDVNQRPKFQNFGEYWFFTIKSLLPSSGSEIESEQLSFVLGRNFLVSFQEKKADYFSHIRQRIRENIGIVRERTSDYLLYLLLESILENYFKTISSIEIQLDEMGLSDIDLDPSPSILNKIDSLQRQIYQIKKTVIPIKEFILKIEREELSLISEKHLKYYYELKDLCLSLIDECEHIDLKLTGNVNLFFSLQGHRMNQVMKILTIVATIFIPLTFIAGIYGMNFEYMPELGWKWGYFAVWFIIVAVFVFMLIYFKRKKWL
jgi:magnesium transporter